MDLENNPQTQWPAPKPLFDLTKRDVIFAFASVLVCILLSVFGIFGGVALGYSVTAFCMLVLFTVYFAKGGKGSVFAILCGLLALANTAVFLCTSNGSVRFFCVVVSFLLSLVLSS